MRNFWITKDGTGGKIHVYRGSGSSRREIACYYLTNEELDNLRIQLDTLKNDLIFADREKVKVVKPKFKVGDWVVNNESKSVSQITQIVYSKVDTDLYGYNHTNGYFANDFENEYHLWTIQDAKPGDVLMCESGWTCIFKDLDLFNEMFSSYCFMATCLDFMPYSSECHTLDSRINGKLTPATEKQHKLFFKKMKEAGYVWDSDKKELQERNKI